MSVSRTDFDRLQRRVDMMLTRGTVKRVDDKKLQYLDVELMHDETPTKVEHFQQYGYTARPKAGAEVLTALIQGNRDHPIVIAYDDRRYRLQGLEDGEMAIYDDQGQKVHIKRSGILVETTKDVTVKSPQKVIVDCPDIRLGSPDATARVMLETGPATRIKGV